MTHPEVAQIAPTRFTAETYRERQARLAEALGEGLILLLAAPVAWRNADEAYPYRQDSHLLYLSGLRRPGLALVLDADEGEATLFGPPEDPDEVIWSGPSPSLQEEADLAGIGRVRDVSELAGVLEAARRAGRALHVLPSRVPGVRLELARLLGVPPEEVKERASEALVRALGEMRMRKSEEEVAEIEAAVAVSAEMYRAAMRAARPGATEAAVRAALLGPLLERGLEASFKPIVSVRGEVLHNESFTNTLEAGQLLLIDSGAETRRGYASDITRTLPVGGRFSAEQRAVYETVLAAQEEAIHAIRPGAGWPDVHLVAARAIAEGMKEIGLMRGDTGAAVEAGAHALFFPHGLGHLLGLDTHDTEDLGDAVLYPPERPRSRQFGLAYLRFGRTLEAGHVLTVEPGVYFIPALIERWEREGRHREFIDYEALARWRGFGGIRIEDDVLCTEEGARVLGPAIPKQPDELEAALGR